MNTQIVLASLLSLIVVFGSAGCSGLTRRDANLSTPSLTLEQRKRIPKAKPTTIAVLPVRSSVHERLSQNIIVTFKNVDKSGAGVLEGALALKGYKTEPCNDVDEAIKKNARWAMNAELECLTKIDDELGWSALLIVTAVDIKTGKAVFRKAYLGATRKDETALFQGVGTTHEKNGNAAMEELMKRMAADEELDRLLANSASLSEVPTGWIAY